MKDELLPCPFCQSKNVIAHKNYNDFFVKCGDCETAGPLSCNHEESIKKWNTRSYKYPNEEELEKLIYENIPNKALVLSNDVNVMKFVSKLNKAICEKFGSKK